MDEEILDPVITGSVILSYQSCARQAWLACRRFVPEHENPYLELGRFIHRTSYRGKGAKEVELPGAKIDVIWKERSVTVVGEIKKSSRSIKGATAQVHFYLKLLKERGIEAKGAILVPLEHRRIEVVFTEQDEQQMERMIAEIQQLASQPFPPPPKWTGICSKCGYGPFCWA